MIKKGLVIRDPNKKISVFDKYFFVDDGVYGYEQIDTIYLINSHQLPISECYKLSKKVDVYLIDHNGYIKIKLTKMVNKNE